MDSKPISQAAYQSIVTLSYVDKLIDQVSLAFRDKYKNELVSGPLRMVNFSQDFHVSLRGHICWLTL